MSVREISTAGEFRASGRAIPVKLGGKNLGVVEYHHIAGPQKRG